MPRMPIMKAPMIVVGIMLAVVLGITLLERWRPAVLFQPIRSAIRHSNLILYSSSKMQQNMAGATCSRTWRAFSSRQVAAARGRRDVLLGSAHVPIRRLPRGHRLLRAYRSPRLLHPRVGPLRHRRVTLRMQAESE